MVAPGSPEWEQEQAVEKSEQASFAERPAEQASLAERPWLLRRESNDPDCGPTDPALLDALVRETGFSPLTLEVCLARGLRDSASIRDFLAPKLENLTDPLLLKDMDRALDRLVRARDAGERLRIFGDYDVDGTTGAALLSWFFRDCGYEFDARQPDRFKDGYGVNVQAVEEASQAGVKVLITVDCGITSFAALDRARELSIDVIVVDHHQLDAGHGLPAAHAVINPQRPDCASGLRQLCGCGLAFYLARALRSRGRELGWWPEGKEPNLKQHLDLVVMATAADMVPLTGDNHILARHGLEVLKVSRKPGVRALMEVSGLGARGNLSPGSLGFVLGPRINASGRMVSASIALELLTTPDPSRGAELAHELERLNAERAQIQNRIWDEVRARVEKGLAEGRYRHGILVADASWHEGVVGIVASRVTETFRRPAAVLALREDFGKGSVRSYGGKDVLAALRKCSDKMLGFGGHKHAAGLSVALDRVEELAVAFDQALGELPDDPALRPLLIEGPCRVADLSLRTVEELEALGPFGPGNPEPVFSLQATVHEHRVLKERHLKLHLMSDADGIEAIWFHAAERSELPKPGDGWRLAPMEWAGVPELNRYRGRVTPTFRIRDCRPIPN
jgi:single-stranded-DNA-specific exonuclease